MTYVLYGAQRQTPDIVMGGGSSGTPISQELIEMLSVKTARDLGVSSKP
jgi:hypothetical protein